MIQIRGKVEGLQEEAFSSVVMLWHVGSNRMPIYLRGCFSHGTRHSLLRCTPTCTKLHLSFSLSSRERSLALKLVFQALSMRMRGTITCLLEVLPERL